MRREGLAVVLAVMCLGLLTSLGGCSLSGAVKGAFSSNSASATYDLVLDQSVIRRSNRLDTQLVVNEPKAVRALSGDNILVKPSPTKVTYYGGAVWGDRLPQLLQARMVEAIRVSGRFRAVSDGSDRINPDVTLASTVEAFQVEVEGERAQARISLFAKLIHVSTGKVFASKKFDTEVAATSREVNEGVAALNEATNVILGELTRWVVKRGRVRIK